MPSPRLVHGHRVVKASPATDHLLWARLHRVADGHAPQFARAFRASVRAMRARVPEADYLGAARGDYGSEGRIVQAVSLVPVLKGDLPGHEFHGNQWTGGMGGERGEKVQAILDKNDRDGLPMSVEAPDRPLSHEIFAVTTSDRDTFIGVGRESEHVAYVAIVEVNEDLRGRGIGKALYVRAGREAAKRDMVLRSDPNRTTVKAQRVWTSLENQGLATQIQGTEGRSVRWEMDLRGSSIAKALDPASVNEMTAYYQSVLYNAAKEAFADLEAQLPNLAQPAFTLTMSNPLVIRYAETLGSALIKDVGQNTIDAVRYIVGQAARVGGHPDDVAKLIRQVVGLDPRRAQALVNFYTGSVLPQVTAGTIRQARADELVSGYADRLLDSRAEAIARTETIRAANMGVRMGGDALLDLPMFTAADLTYVWIVTPDDLLCPYCEAMDGQETAGENGSFQSDDYGDIESPPLHPRCRCCIARRVADVEDLQARMDAQDEAAAALSPDANDEGDPG